MSAVGPDEDGEAAWGATGARTSLGRVGFESGSDLYERARPGYPREVLDHLEALEGIGPDARVLDLAAGTGKLTRQLHARWPRCLAVEPSPSMRDVFARSVPDVPLMAATAEAVPVASGAFDLVVAAQAFHWFDAGVALPEIARVLRPGGWLALVWNERDESDPMVAELVRISKWDLSAPYPVGMDFGSVIDASHRFGTVERIKFPWHQRLDRGTFVDQVATRSYVQVLPPAEQQTLLGQVADFATTLDEPIDLPYVSDLFCARVTR
jgi:SAM-dependent methyltransferase